MARSASAALIMEKTRRRKARIERSAVTGPWVDWKFPWASGNRNINRTHTTADTLMHRPNSDVSIVEV